MTTQPSRRTLKRKYSSSSSDEDHAMISHDDQDDGVSSSSSSSWEKEELKALFCNYIDRLSRKRKASKKRKIFIELAQTLHDLPSLTNKKKLTATKNTTKKIKYLCETDSSNGEKTVQQNNNLKNFFEKRISKLCLAECKPRLIDSSDSDLNENHTKPVQIKNKNVVKGLSAKMIVKDKLLNKDKKELIKSWTYKHFENHSMETNVISENLQLKSQLLNLKTKSKDFIKSDVSKLSSSLSPAKVKDTRSKDETHSFDSGQIITLNSSCNENDDARDNVAVSKLSTSPLKVKLQCMLISKQSKQNNVEKKSVLASESQNKNDTNAELKNKYATHVDNTVGENEVLLSDEISKNKPSKEKKVKKKKLKSKHKSHKSHHRIKTSNDGDNENKSLAKNLEKKSESVAEKGRSRSRDIRLQSEKSRYFVKRDSNLQSRSRSRSRCSRGRRRNETTTNRREHSSSQSIASSGRRGSEEYIDVWQRKQACIDRQKHPKVKRVRNFLSLDSSVEEVYSCNETSKVQKKLSPRRSSISRSDESLKKEVGTKVHSRWLRNSEDSELSKDSCSWQLDVEKQKPRQHDSQENSPNGRCEFKRKSCSKIKKRLRHVADSSPDENICKNDIVSNSYKDKYPSVTIDLEDMISTEDISTTSEKLKLKESSLKMDKNAKGSECLTDVNNDKARKSINGTTILNPANQTNVVVAKDTSVKEFIKVQPSKKLELENKTSSHKVELNPLGKPPLKISFKPRPIIKHINKLAEASINMASSKFDALFMEKNAKNDNNTNNNNNSNNDNNAHNSKNDNNSSKVALISTSSSLSGGTEKMVNTSARIGGWKTISGDGFVETLHDNIEKEVVQNGRIGQESLAKQNLESQHCLIEQNKESIRSNSMHSVRSVSRSVEHWKSSSRGRSRSSTRSRYYSSRSRDESRKRRSYRSSSRSRRRSYCRSYSRNNSYTSQSSRDSFRWRPCRVIYSNASQYSPRRDHTRRTRRKSYSSRSSSRGGSRRLRSYRDWSSFSSRSYSSRRRSYSRSASRNRSRRKLSEKHESRGRRSTSGSSKQTATESSSAESEIGSNDISTERAIKEGHLIYECGDILLDRYEMLSTLGAGTFSKVVDCVDLKSKKHVALKIIKNIPKYIEAAELEVSILKNVAAKDPNDENFCIRLHSSFDHLGHRCLVFDSLGLSLYEFLKNNYYQPFTIEQTRHVGVQLLKAIKFLHGIGLMHTDLKPENVLFVNSDFSVLENHEQCTFGHRSYNMLKQSDIRLIDFGSAVYENEPRLDVVSTRQYRAVEVILELGWHYPCDVWSIGCILFEMYSGHTLFQTHSNIEHLAMMEAILGPIPTRMVQKSKKRNYFSGIHLKWDKSSKRGKNVTSNCKSFKKYMLKGGVDHHDLFDLMLLMLTYEPEERVTVDQALEDRFFSKYLIEKDDQLIN